MQAVCRHLCKKGMQTLAELSRALGPQESRGADSGAASQPALTQAQIKQALLVLLQHNWVNAYLHKDEQGLKNPRPPQTFYEADVPRILQGIRCACGRMGEHVGHLGAVRCGGCAHGWCMLWAIVLHARCTHGPGTRGGPPPPGSARWASMMGRSKEQ